MRRSWLMCVLLGGLAWGQAQPGGAAPSAGTGRGRANTAVPQAAGTMPDTAESVPASAAVLTITGVCKPQPRPAAAKAGAAAAKPAAKTAPADCKTVVTRAEFEKLINSISTRPTPQLKKQVAAAYPSILAFAQAAQKQGLDKTARFETQVKFDRLQILARALREKVSDDAAKVSDADVEKYYQDHLSTYQQFNLDRVFVPHFRQPEAKADEKDSKDDKDEKDAKAAAETQQNHDQEEAKLAETLQ